MKAQKKTSSWIERVEELITILEGSSIGELELTEGGTEITIRREPGMLLVNAANHLAATKPGSDGLASQADSSVAIAAPLTGVYYSAASPTSPPFVNIGDVIQVGQVVALIEAMKVFNEVTADVAGRVTALPATNGNVVQKGEVLLRVEPV